jgi:alpha-N-arabinofuranosidase
MPTFGTWERTVLEHCFDHVEYVSLHTYLNNYADDLPAFLAAPDLMDDFIDEVVSIADQVAAARRSGKRIMLSFDEWNVWYRTRRHPEQRTVPGWPVAPPILEEAYTMADALAFGGACISLLNHADRVKVACLAQLVNVIAPIMTEDGGPAWRQTIFYPFAQMSHFGRGQVLRAEIDSPNYDARYFDPRGTRDLWFPVTAPFLKLAAVRSHTGGVTLFALNRHLTEPMPLTVETWGFTVAAIRAARTLRHADLNATNSRDAPETVRPAPLDDISIAGGTLRATLPPASWNVVRL